MLKAGLIKKVEDREIKNSPIDSPTGVPEYEPTEKAKELYQKLEKEDYFKEKGFF